MIRVGFSRAEGVLPWLVRAITRARADRCWLLVDDPLFGGEVVFEVDAFGFTVTPFVIFRQGNEVLSIIEPMYPLDRGMQIVAHYLSTRDRGGAVRHLVSAAWRWIKKKLRFPTQVPSVLLCTEGIVRVLQGSSYPGAQSLVAEKTDPQKLLEFFKNAMT